MESRYELKLAAAYVRGCIRVPGELADCGLDELSEAECMRLVEAGSAAGLKMYRFKKKEELPRVKKVIGFLKGVQPASLLDVGSGRGAFLFPFLQEFPYVPVTSVDLLEHRVALMEAMGRGGLDNLTALRQDICSWDMPDGSFDVVTLLEVLEHIPDVQRAVNAAVRLAQRYVVASVPSKEDDNPEHIHLLTRERLTALFVSAGCTRLQFDGVNGHLLMTARIE